MLRLKLQFQNKKGFTLVELVLGTAILSILIITLYTSVSFSLKMNHKSTVEDEMILNGRYILEYIKEEISSADKIILSNVFENLDTKYPRNIGFVILNLDKKRDTNTGKILYPITYSYTTYYFQNDKIIRINAKKLINREIDMNTKTLKEISSKVSNFSGHNELGYNLSNKSKIQLNDNNTISLELLFKDDEFKVSSFKSKIFVRCEVAR